MDPTRVYKIPSMTSVYDVQFDEEPMRYIRIYFEDGPETHQGDFYQIKLESSSTIVIDHFNAKGDLVEEIGAWDFWND